jgi:hypothetical protein
MGPRILLYDDNEDFIDENVINVILDSIKCPICLEIFD